MALGAYEPDWVHAGDPAGAFARGEELGLRRRQLRQEDQRTKAADALRKQNQEMLNNYRKQQADDRAQSLKDREEAARDKADALKAAHSDTVAFQSEVKTVDDIPGAMLRHPNVDPHVADTMLRIKQAQADKSAGLKTKQDEDAAKATRQASETKDTAGFVSSIPKMTPAEALKAFPNANPTIVGAALNRAGKEDAPTIETTTQKIPATAGAPGDDAYTPGFFGKMLGRTPRPAIPAIPASPESTVTTRRVLSPGQALMQPGPAAQTPTLSAPQNPPIAPPVAGPQTQQRPLGQKVTTAKGSFTWGGPDKGWLPVQAEQPSAPVSAPQLPEGVP